MTIAIAWVAKQADGLRHLYFASDSRIRGGYVFDACPKVLTLPRSDSAICFAGDLGWSFPLMSQIRNAIAAHGPSRKRNLDIAHLKDHLLRIATDLVNSAPEPDVDFATSSAKFIFGGYSWRKADFLLWTLSYDTSQKMFVARPSVNVHPRLKQAAFIGDWATRYRGKLIQQLNTEGDRDAEHEPLIELAKLVKDRGPDETIGGAPQVIRIGAHMNTRTFCVPWAGHSTLFGRRLFPYENCDYWSIDPNTGLISPPAPIGQRPDPQ